MAHTIFSAEDNQNLLARLEKLTAETRPLWGKMNASQLVLHCQKPLDVATGQLRLSGGLMGFLFGKMAKSSMIKNLGFGKNSPTHPKFKVAHNPDFDAEKHRLMDLVRRFGEVGPAIVANKKHPFFGEMNDEEWGLLQYLHLDHHLKQFSC
jgi:hypothetical protein